MLIEQKFSAFDVVNDFSKQLFLIKTPSDFNKGLNGAFKNTCQNIELYIYFRFNWEENTFIVVSSNYLKDIDDIPLEKSKLEEILLDFITKNKLIHNPSIQENRKDDLLSLINTSTSGSEVIFPLVPVNDAVGILYVYSKEENHFDSEKIETVRLIGNMISRTWNLINYQAHQIKSHKKAELEVVNQKNLMNEIFDYLPINIFTKDKDGKYLYRNKNAEESTGVKQKDAIGKTVFDIYQEDTARKLNKDDIEVRRTKMPKISQHEIEIKDRIRHVFTGKKIINTSQNKELLIGFSVDITQNIQVSKAIEDQKKFFQQIFNTVPSFIYVKNNKGKYLLVMRLFRPCLI